jgi:hypothetical protein
MKKPPEVVIALMIIQASLPPGTVVEWHQIAPESQQELLRLGKIIVRGLPSEGYRIVDSILQ